MRPYSEFAPTGCDLRGLNAHRMADGNGGDWLVAPCTTDRDADALQRSNWAVMTEELDRLDPDCADHETHSFGHWACGWFEIAIVRPGSKCAETCEAFESALSDYPVLSDDHFSDLEHQESCDYWASLRLSERVELCSKHGASIFAARRDSPPDCDGIWEYLRDS